MKLFALAGLMALVSCGYHAAGHSDLMPKTIQTICIPAFGNATTRYKLTDRMPEALAREFISRTRYKIVSDPNTADAVLKGTINNYIAGATVIDPVTSRATAADIHVYLSISLVERATGKVLFSRPAMSATERYEISANELQYFEESDAGLNRVAQTVARLVVSSILSNF